MYISRLILIIILHIIIIIIIATIKGFKEQNIESITSTYPFYLGKDKDYQYKAVTLPITQVIDDYQGSSIARKIYDDNINDYTMLDQETESLVLPNNIFVMTTITK